MLIAETTNYAISDNRKQEPSFKFSYIQVNEMFLYIVDGKHELHMRINTMLDECYQAWNTFCINDGTLNHFEANDEVVRLKKVDIAFQ